MSDVSAQDHLNGLADVDDAQIDLARSGVYLASFAHDNVPLGQFFHHLETMQKDALVRYEALIAQGAADDAGVRLAALKYAIAECAGYKAGQGRGMEIENADLIRVIRRRIGCPVALGVLYISTARALGWLIDGLALPSYFVCRLEHGAERVIFDPSEACRILLAPDLRAIVKKAQGEKAELSAQYIQAQSNRAILIMLHNTIKHKFIEMGDYLAAVEEIERLRCVDPAEYRLLLDAGVLYARLHETARAVDCLESYMQKAPAGRDRREVEALLYELKNLL